MKFKTPAANSRFAKAGLWCYYESEVLYSSFVHLIKFSANNPPLRQAPKRYFVNVKINYFSIIKKFVYIC
jgi:hypothetical protein